MTRLSCYKPDDFTAARPYAKAIFAYARDQKALLSCQKTLETLARLLEHEDLAKWLSASTANEHASMAKLMVKHANIKPADVMTHWLNLMFAHKRLTAMRAVYVLYERMMADEMGYVIADIRSAYPLADSQKHGMVEWLKVHYAVDQVQAHYVVDETLMAGIEIQVGDDILKHHLPHRLSMLQQSLRSLVNER